MEIINLWAIHTGVEVEPQAIFWVSFGDGSISRFISSPDPEGLQNHATELRVEPRTVMLSMEKSILDLDEISLFCYPEPADRISPELIQG